MTDAHRLSPRSLSLKTRLAVASLALFLISVWGMALYTANELKSDMEDLLTEQQRAMANSIAQAIGTSVRVRKESLMRTATDISPELLKNGRDLAKQLGVRHALRSLFDSALFVTTPAGRLLARYPASSVRADVNFWQPKLITEIAEKKRAVIGSPDMNVGNKRATVLFGSPILDQSGMVQGLLFGMTSLLATDFVENAPSLASNIGYLVISKSTRVILASHDKSRVMQFAPAPGVNKLIDRFVAGYEGSGTTVNSRGIEELSSAKAVSDTDWVVAVSIPASDAFEPVTQMRKRIFFSATLLSLLVGAAVWLIVKRTLKSLDRLVDHITDMGALEAPLTQFNLEPVAPEIGKLVSAFNRAQERIADQAAVLRENEARFHFVADNSPMLIWISDETGQRIWFNQTWLKFTGCGMGPIREDSWTTNMHPEDMPSYLDTFRHALAEGQPAKGKYRLRDASGGYRWFLEIAVPRLIGGGTLAGYVGSCLDIDEQVKAQRTAENLLRENRALMADRFNVEETQRRQLAMDLHDDLGQLLTAVHINAQAICAIAGREEKGKILHCASSIITSTTSIQNRVRAINRNLGSDALVEFGINEGLKDLVGGWCQTHSDTKIEISLDDNLGRLDSSVESTTFRLVQEALNNIARHARASRATVTCWRQSEPGSDELWLSITDDGVGFDYEHDTQGVGLIGMRERTLALGGSFTVTTEPGKGTSVEICIPLTRDLLKNGEDDEHRTA
ncbi:MAG: PAS domain-containing protein [Betaproteobacteria bacterium]|nr:PAS domain-containing protein [Betaproteobacteria bacterium]